MTRRVVFALAAVLFASVAALSVFCIERVEDIDSGSYRLMAAGEPACRPYANRILHPAIAGALSSLKRCGGYAFASGMNKETSEETSSFGFGLLAVASSAVFYLCVLSLTREIRPRWWIFLLLVSPLWWVWGGNIYIQDMFAAALTAVLFLLLRGEPRFRAVYVFAVLFVLQLTRESTAVLAVVLAALALWRRERRLALAAAAATLAGMAAVAWASRDALPNTNELGGLAYLVCKSVANGIRNLTGIVPWNDGYAANLPWHYPNPPLWKCTLPSFLQAGNVHEVGVYAVNAKIVLFTLVSWLLYFPGTALFAVCRAKSEPYIVSMSRNVSVSARLKALLRALRSAPLYVQYAFVAGFIFWLLTPFSGASVERLAGYSWPLFWVAVPWLFRGK